MKLSSEQAKVFQLRQKLRNENIYGILQNTAVHKDTGQCKRTETAHWLCDLVT